MNAWRGVVVQVTLILAMLAITLVAMFRGANDGLLHLLVGALCTAFGTVVAKARTDAGGGDGSGLTMRPPAPRVSLPPNDSQRRALAMAYVLGAALLFASVLLFEVPR